MTVLALIVGIAAFVGLLKLMRAAEVGGDAIRVAQAAVTTMSAADLSDHEKELQIRRAAGRMFRSFLIITVIGIVALAVPAAIVWAGSAIGLYTLDGVAEVATGWPFLVGSTVGAVLLWAALERLR